VTPDHLAAGHGPVSSSRQDRAIGTAKYAVVYERTERGYFAYVPDLPGCVATGRTRADVARNIRDAISMHLDGLRAGRGEVPRPRAWTELIET
jgi:predicted RNase H-like HicB family nuclease